MNTVTANGLIVLGWGLSVYLVYSMLLGPFDGRLCESTCFGMLYWGALLLALLGTILGVVQIIKRESGLASKIVMLLGLLLSIMLAGVMVIGTLTS